MKLFLLANANSVHTQRWALALAEKGVKVFLFSLPEIEEADIYQKHDIEVFSYGFSNKMTMQNGIGFLKIKYLQVLSTLKEKIKGFSPDILHAHYVSGYGTLGALSGFHPFVVSVWGSDIYDFPKKSFLHKQLIKYNLRKADKILSTSHVMAKETKKYTDKSILITPFGIDINKFRPMLVDSLFETDDIVIGTVKTLENKYGIEYLVRAFKILDEQYNDLPLKLLIVGGGNLEYKLKELVKDLGIQEKVVFTGKVPFSKVPIYHNMLSVSVSVSNSESFGVAIIEASSCAKPVVVSNVGGLPEVVEDGVSGFVVPPRDPEATAKAIEKLILNEKLRIKIGNNGRDRVKRLYSWDDNVAQMINIYKEVVK
jgi:glycosyltransferase involved in cell wall biosynthesis